MKRTLMLALLVVFVACASAVSAQTLTGTIAGKVTDEQGGVLPGVTITLTGSTGSQTQVTDARGEYRFIGLTPGAFTVKAEIQGFRPKEQQNVDVGLSRTVEVNLSLAVGGVTETVNVVASAVTIDTTTTATDTNMSQDLLFSMPVTHNNPAANLLNYIPGVVDSSAFGGAASGGNSLMLDGVDTRDPEGGTAWTFYNFNIIDEVQVGSLGQQAEYGGFTGAVINTITKSGGNRFSFLSEYRYTSTGLAGNNAPDSVIKLNPLLAKPNIVRKMHDYTVQVGGPLKKDKLFFHASTQRFQIEQRISGAIRSEISPRFNFKLTYQPTPTDTITGSFQYDQYNQKGRTGFVPGYAITDSAKQTIDQDSPEWVYNAQYRKVFGSSTFFEAKFLGWWGYYDLNPTSPDSGHYDGDTGAYSGGAGWLSQYDRTRNQLNVALSQYAKLAGTHNFKFGAEIERSTIRDRFQYAGNGVYYYDWGGEPYLAYGYTYDLKGENKRESYYAQDQWKAGRFTANLGVRMDRIRGESTVDKKDLYKTLSIGPRLGFALDVTGKGTSVVKAYYGQLYESANFSSWSRAVPGLTDTIGYIVGPNWSSLTEDPDLRTPAELKFTVKDKIKHPRVDEYNVAWEQQIARDFKLTATYINRNWKNFINSVLIDGQWTAATTTNPIGGTIPVYKWANKGIVPERFLIQNTDSVTYLLSTGSTLPATGYRKYQGLMLIFQRAYKDRWQAQISYVLSRTTGTISNSTYGGISSGQFETPNTIVGMYDGPTEYNRTHEIKVFVGYQIPKAEISVNAYWAYLSGWPYAAYKSVSKSDSNWSGSVSVNMNERGSSAPDPVTKMGIYQWTDNRSHLDVRFEKVFKFGMHRFGLYGDVQNMLNAAGITTRESRYPNRSLTDYEGNSFTLNFGGPRAMQAAPQVTFGARWSF